MERDYTLAECLKIAQINNRNQIKEERKTLFNIIANPNTSKEAKELAIKMLKDKDKMFSLLSTKQDGSWLLAIQDPKVVQS